MILELITVLAVSIAASLILTPCVRSLARRLDFVDRPEGERKLHARVIPLGGGVAVLLAAIVGVLLAALFPAARNAFLTTTMSLPALLAAAAIITVVGLIDDRLSLRGRQKLLGQILAISILVAAGLRIEQIGLFETSFSLGLLAIPFTMFWLLGAINALNLLDGADGFASTIGIMISGSIAIMAATTGHPTQALLAAALTGALIGFLRFNWPPASIFLGDGGSMLIGLVVGVMAIRSSLKGPATVALAAPLAILAIPILDSVAAVVRRSLTGRGLCSTDRGHLHHRLQRTGIGPRSMLIAVALLCAATSTGALISIYLRNDMLAFGCAGVVLGILVVSRVFGFSEMVLLANQTLSFGSSLVTSTANKHDHQRIWQHSVSLQGSRNWDELWSALTDFAQQHGLLRVSLDLSISWLHEAYHAVWQRNQKIVRAESWQTRLPLNCDGRTIGRLEIAGPGDDAVASTLSLFAELLDSLEPCIRGVAADLPRGPLETEEMSPKEEEARMKEQVEPAVTFQIPGGREEREPEVTPT